MDSFSVCVTLLSVLLGIAYPILIQITSNDKYSSEKILDLFENHRYRKFFIPNLIVALTFVGIYLLKLSPIFYFENEFMNSALENSACIIIFILTILLIINFLLITHLVTIFYRTSSLIKFLDSKSDIVIEKNDFSSFDCMADLLYWSIQNQDSNASKQLILYFSKMFRIYQDKHKTKNELIYPDRFYWLTYSTTEKIAGMDRNNLIAIEHRAVGGIWLLGEFNAPKISDATYRSLWTNLAVCLNNDRGDLIITFWQATHQYFIFNLPYINPDYDMEGDGFTIKNKKEIEDRNQERESFLEFHYALGGLLLYKDRPDLIKKIFFYTTSTPPEYVLLPTHMSQILNMFFKFFDPYGRHFPWITHKYDFPGLEGLNADYTIKDWICQYIAILFIRQFNLQSYYTNWNPDELPQLPADLPTKRFWAENIKYFKPILEKTLKSNKKLLEDLHYNTDTAFYLSRLEEIEKHITNDFSRSQEEVVPEMTKIEQFMEVSEKIIKPVFEVFDKLRNPAQIDPAASKLTFAIQGLVNITSKGDFTNDGVESLNFDSFLAESARRKYADAFFSIFNSNASKKYVFNQENVFSAIDQLELDPARHIIVLFGSININFYIENLKIHGLHADHYNNVPLLFFQGHIPGIPSSLFIIAKTSLPEIIYEDLEQNNIDLYQARPIIKPFNVYAAVSDLHTNNQLRLLIENEPYEEDKDLHKSVWQGIIFKTVLKWQKNISMVQIIIPNQFDNQRKKNELNDVSPSDLK